MRVSIATDSSRTSVQSTYNIRRNPVEVLLQLPMNRIKVAIATLQYLRPVSSVSLSSICISKVQSILDVSFGLSHALNAEVKP